jgi:hypothetical protein
VAFAIMKCEVGFFFFQPFSQLASDRVLLKKKQKNKKTKKKPHS